MSSKEYPRPSLSSLSRESSLEENTTFLHHPRPEANPRRQNFPLFLLAISLILSNAGWALHQLSTSSQALPIFESPRPTRLRALHWDTEYSSANKTAANALWKGLFPNGQGIIAIPNTEARERHLPASIKHNANASESVYFVAAWHQIHCLTVIRAALYHFSEGVEQTVPLVHTLHCLDSLRQEVICHADDDLLYTDDGKVFGDGQVRECRDWEKLKEWTEERRI